MKIDFELDTISVKRSIGIIATGIIALAYVLFRNVNKLVKKYPWCIVLVISVIYTIASIIMYTRMTALTKNAEAQRDSIAYEYDRVTNTTAYRILK